MGESPVRVLLVDDHEITRIGVRLVLSRSPRLRICCEASDGEEAVSLAASCKPDVVVLDLALPRLQGLEATRQIKQQRPDTEILILTGYEPDEQVVECFSAGASGYLNKLDSATELVQAITALSEHRSFITAEASRTLSRFLSHRGDGEASQLTPRETEVLKLVAEGKKNKEVAALLKIGVKTVETHRAPFMKKLNLKSAGDVVRYAIRHRIIEA